MFPEIHSTLRLDRHKLAQKHVNIVQDLSADATFLMHHFLSHAMKQNANILIVALEQTFGNFHGVGLKLGQLNHMYGG